MINVHFFTIASSNYLPQIAVLKTSLDATHPDVPFTIFLCDELPDEVPPALEDANIRPISRLNLPSYESMATRYTTLELNTAVKPFMFAYLFDKLNVEFAFYLDPDLLAVTRLQECFDLIDGGANIILTPHTLRPIEDGLRPNDFDMAKSGIYNLGFCGVSTSEVGREFIGWWCRKLLLDCRVDIENGIFVDQKWCDAVPALYSGVHILRHEGYNVGYWNLMHRPLSVLANGTMKAGKHEARLLHFSGIDMHDHTSVSKYQDRLNTHNLNPVTRDAFSAYRFQMMASSYFNYARRPQMLPGHRLFKADYQNANYARLLSSLSEEVGHADRLPNSKDVQNFALGEELTPRPAYLLPDFLYVLRAMRADLMEAFSDLESMHGVAAYLDWVAENGLRETPLVDADTVGAHVKWHRQALSVIAQKPIKNAPAKFIDELFKFHGNFSQHQVFAAIASLDGNYLSGIEYPPEPAPIPAFLKFIYVARGDLSASFDIETIEGRVDLLAWAVRAVDVEYGTHAHLEEFFDAVADDPVNWAAQWLKPNRIKPIDMSAGLGRSDWSRAINFGYQPASDYAIFEQRDPQNRIAINSPSASLLTLPTLAAHVTLIGYPRAEMGMGEHIRNTACALDSVSIPYEIFSFERDIQCGLGNDDYDKAVVAMPSGKVNIFHVNADETLLAHKMLGDSLFKGRYNIGYWAWELERFPEIWRDAIHLVDELWAPSKFIQGALRQMTDKPVIHMPLRVERLPEARIDLDEYGVPGDAFSFLFYFDFNSFHGRKNPMGVVNAFREAFPQGGDSRVALIIKTIGADHHAAAAEKLHSIIRNDRRIVMIEGTLPAAAMAALIKQSDCFVSLHRSEGFGRGLAEAMAAGRIVIGTGYGGNMDFMSSESAYLVDYKLVPVGKNSYLHCDGARWAEPSVADAAQLMRHVFNHREEAALRAAVGERMINQQHSTAAVAANLGSRLAELEILGDARSTKGSARTGR